MTGARTLIWPVGNFPLAPPKSPTRRSRASRPLTAGHGWPGRQLSSISRAATPAIRILGPSAHQIGPSPSHTAVGVHVKVRPADTTGTASDSGGRKLDRMTHSKTLAANFNTRSPSTSGDSAAASYRPVEMLEMVAENSAVSGAESAGAARAPACATGTSWALATRVSVGQEIQPGGSSSDRHPSPLTTSTEKHPLTPRIG